MIKIDGRKIKAIREEKGLTQLYIATAVGVTTDTVSRWENRRYPAVKEENANRLAEVLEVTVDDLLEEGEVESNNDILSSDNETKTDKTPSDRFYFKTKNFIYFLTISFFVIGAVLWFNLAEENCINEPDKIEVLRFMPAHTPAGSSFPVVVYLEFPCHDEKLSVILKENLPESIFIKKSIPPLPGSSDKIKSNGGLKWIVRSRKNGILVCYLAQIKKEVSSADVLKIKGDIILRHNKGDSIDVDGDDEISLEPWHWADSNRDGRIDDEEILAVYDRFGSMKELDFGLELIKKIWSGADYRWDTEKNAFIINAE